MLLHRHPDHARLPLAFQGLHAVGYWSWKAREAEREEHPEYCEARERDTAHGGGRASPRVK